MIAKRITPVILAFVIVLALIDAAIGASKPPPGPVATFVIEQGSQASLSVELKGEAVSATCKLEYDTSIVEEVKKKDFVPAPQLLEQMTKKYGCMKFHKDIFDYEICLGKDITQIVENGDKYSLGTFEASEGHGSTQIFTHGSHCEAAHIDRKTTVEFTCADKAKVQDITEFEGTCRYRVTVGVPEVCGHPQFTVSVDKVEAWVLEISETDEGALICQVYNNGLDVLGSNTFSSFSLSLSSSGDYSLTKYLVRDNKRKVLDSSMVKRSSSPASISIKQRYQIDYAKIVAE